MCQFETPVKNITYDDTPEVPIVGRVDFKLSKNHSGVFFCLEVPNGYQVVISFGEEETEDEADYDALKFSTATEPTVFDGSINIKDKIVKWQNDETQDISISKIE